MADENVFEVVVPREVRLAQRRLLGSVDGPLPALDRDHLGVFLLEVKPGPGAALPSMEAGGRELERGVLGAISESLRDCDLPGKLAEWTYLAIARDVNASQAGQMASRILKSVASWQLLAAVGARVRLGYIVYPLTAQPDFPPMEWRKLLDLCSVLGNCADPSVRAAGRGLIPLTAHRPEVSEVDLVQMALSRIESVTEPGLVRLERVQLLFGDLI